MEANKGRHKTSKKDITKHVQDSELYDAHVRTVYGFFMAKTYHRELAEDLTSEVFTTAFEQFVHPSKQIDDKEKYLYGIMKLVWLQYLRRKYAQPETSVEQIEDFSSYVTSELQVTKERSLIDRALPYIKQLPKSQQVVLLLRFQDGLALAEIAVRLGRNMNYVKTTQRRGIASLKRIIEGERV